jgi:hypothetical protein
VSRRNQLLGAAVIAVWAVFLAVERPWQGDAHAQTAAAVRPLFPDFARQRENVRRVDLRGEDGTVALEWREDRWWVREKEHPADLRRLMQVIDMLGILDTRDPVAVSPLSHSTYGVAAGQGTRITLTDAQGAVIADWIVGQLRGQDVSAGNRPVLEFYMRRADRPEVYLSGAAISPPTDAVLWCDTRFLATAAAEDIEWVRREDFESGESWRLERVPAAERDAAGATWRLTEPAPAQPALDFAGDSLVQTLITLRAADVLGRADPATDEARYGFPLDRFQVSVNGQLLRFELGKPAGPGQRSLRVEGLPYVYALGDFEVSQLRQTAPELLSDEQDG